MFRKPLFWIVIVIVLALAAGTYYLVTTNNAKTAAVTKTTTTTLQTATVRQGNLVISAVGTGTLVPASTVDLSFPKSGLLAEVNVKVGDKVTMGQVLAKQGNLTTFEANISSDKLALLVAQQAVDDLKTNLETDRAKAQATLVAAEKTLAEAIFARDSYGTQRCDAANIQLLYGTLVTAETNFYKQDSDFNSNYAQLPENDARRIAAYGRWYNAKTAMETALRNYNYCTGATVDTWTTKNLAAAADTAQAAYNVAKANVEQLKNGPDPIKLAQAQAKVDSAKLQLSVDEQALKDTTMICPLAGVVTAVRAQAGATQSGTLITIADIYHPQILTYMDQTDLNSFGLNFAVSVTFDALPNKAFSGKVTAIEPALVNQSGVSYVRGTVTMDESAIDAVSKLPTGMTAAVEVISGQANNALLIPVEALRTLSAGSYAVFVVQADQSLKLTPVTIGLQDLTNVQVLTGLKVGDIVSTGNTAVKTNTGTTK